jgi:hypothetical protein
MGTAEIRASPLAVRKKTIPRKSIHTEISPLRCTSVEMTKGRAVLPGRIVAEQKMKMARMKPLVMKNGSCSATTVDGGTALPFVISTEA